MAGRCNCELALTGQFQSFTDCHPRVPVSPKVALGGDDIPGKCKIT